MTKAEALFKQSVCGFTVLILCVTTAVAASTSRLNRPAFDSRIHPGSLIDLRDPLIRQQQVEDLRQKAIQANLAATQKAQSLGWSISGITSTGQQYQLMAVENGIPRYYTSLNACGDIKRSKFTAPAHTKP